MAQLEELGLLKMDFLGLRTLTVLGKAVKLLQDAGHDISLETIPLEDANAFALLRRGRDDRSLPARGRHDVSHDGRGRAGSVR